MSMLREGLAMLRAHEETFFGEDVTYRKADGTSLVLKAVLGHTTFVQRDAYGTFVRIESRDIIIRREQLTSAPERGDEIVIGNKVFEVVAPSGEPAWRWSDPLETAYRIHTKLVGEE